MEIWEKSLNEESLRCNGRRGTGNSLLIGHLKHIVAKGQWLAGKGEVGTSHWAEGKPAAEGEKLVRQNEKR